MNESLQLRRRAVGFEQRLQHVLSLGSGKILKSNFLIEFAETFHLMTGEKTEGGPISAENNGRLRNRQKRTPQEFDKGRIGPVQVLQKENGRRPLGQRRKNGLHRSLKMRPPELGADVFHFGVVKRIEAANVGNDFFVISRQAPYSRLDFFPHRFRRIVFFDPEQPVQQID